MKRIIAGAALALPLAIASLPSRASALEIIINPHVHPYPSRVIVDRPYEHDERGWVPGHWEHRHGERVWIRGHYE